MEPLKAIETRYRGCRFRSRTEARWAVFFDALNIEWQYEKEGFELPSGRYLPDFWLPEVQAGCWFEVKGPEASARERQLAQELADGSGFPVYVFANQQIRAELIHYGHDALWNALTTEGHEVFGYSKEMLWNSFEKQLAEQTEDVQRWFRSRDEMSLQQPSGTGFFPGVKSYADQRFYICADCGLIGVTAGFCYLPCQEGLIPARQAMQKQPRTPFQIEVVSRHCNCGGQQNREQLKKLKAAFDRASSARFEYGENG